MSNSDTSSRAYISRIQAQNITATVASGGRGSNSGSFTSFLSTILGSIQSVIDPPASPPETPTLFGAIYDDTSITLSWNNVGNVTGTIIDILSGSTTTSTEITGSGNTKTITGLNANTLYSVRVSSFNAVGPSVPTGYIVLTTLQPRPTDLSAIDISFTEVCLEWTDNVVGDISGHNIKYSAYPYSSTSTIFVDYDPSVGTPYWRTVTGLIAGTFYRFNVATVTVEDGNSAFSDTLTVGTLTQAPATVVTPTGLTAGTITSTTVDLSWNNMSTATDAVIDYSDNSGTTWNTWDHTGDFITDGSATVTYLTPSTTYSFRVSTINADGTSAPSTVLSGIITLAAPDAPIDLSAGTITSTTVVLNWTNTTTATDALIEFSDDAGSSWGTRYHIETLITGSSFTVTELTPNTMYSFRVSTINAVGTSAPSTVLSGIMTAAAAPDAPNSLTAGTITSTTVDLTWTNTSTATDALIEYSSDSEASWNPWDHTGTYITDGSATVTGLTPSTTYSFRVSTVDGSVTSDPSIVLSGIMTAPDAPTGLIAGTITSTTVDLTWTNTSTATDALIEYSSDSEASWNPWDHTGTSITTGAATVTYLTPNTMYSFRVSTINAGGTSAPSTVLSGIMTAPDAPNSLTAGTITSTTVDLTWTNTSTATDALIEYSSDSEASWNLWDHTGTYITDGSATVTGLTPSTPYSFRVSTINAGGTSPPTVLSGITTLAPPDAPTNVVGIQMNDSNTIALTWDIGTSTPTYQLIEIFLDTNADGAPDTWTDVVTFVSNMAHGSADIDMSGSAGGSYTFRVTITTANGTSLPSVSSSPIAYEVFPPV
jgi:hypothetical protein